MSRAHLSITVERTGIRVTDVGSTNGTNGTDELRSGHVLSVGTSRLRLAPPLGPRLPQRPTGDGRIEVDPPYRQRPAIAPATLDLPPAPGPPSPPRIPWAAALMSIPLAAVLAFVVGPQLLWLAIMGPTLALGSAAAERALARRRHRRALLADAQAMADLDSRITAVLTTQAELLDTAFPDPACVLDAAVHRAAPLWGTGPPDPAFARVRLGWGKPRAQVALVEPSPPRPADPARPSHPVRHADAPVVLDLLAQGALVVRGEPGRTRGVIDGLVGQLAVLHRPSDLSLHVIDATVSPWRWLPHNDTPENEGIVLQEHFREITRTGSRSTQPSGRQIVVVPQLPDDVDLAALLADAHAAGVTVIVGVTMGLTPAGVPVLDVEVTGGVLTVGDDVTRLEPDQVGARWVHRLTRALAPLTDPECRVPISASASPADLAPALAWPTAGGGPDRAVATVGICHGRPWQIDLDRDGPHILVGGTTGSGKSEFLRTLVGALAARLPPEDLSLVLVDYKGGASFGACADLPHTAGVLTDLSPGLAQRALRALQAEVRRREHLLAQRGVSDRAAYLSSVGNAAERARMTRLVIVIDEFRALAQDQPEVLSGIIHLAAVGRSLGVHLVLATQRPGGVVGPEVRANVNLRIALRVRDRHDSMDVIESPDAASLPTEPGHALARTGDGDLIAFRVIALGLPRPGRPEAVRWADGATTAPAARPDDPSQLDELAAQLSTESRRRGSPLPPPIWLPPLPDRLPASQVPDPRAFALADLPEQQHQQPMTWQPGDGHVLVVGGPRSGRTTTLRALVEAVAQALPPDQVHIHILAARAGPIVGPGTGAGPIADDDVPHLGTVLGPEPRRARALLERLRREVQDGTNPAHTVLVIDDLDTVDGPDRLAPTGLGELVHQLAALAPDRLSILAAGGRSTATGPLGRLTHHLLVLPMPDLADRALVGVGSADVPSPWPPGRILRRDPERGWVQAQVVIPGDRRAHPGRRTAFVFCDLPDVVSPSDLHAEGPGWPLALAHEPRHPLVWVPARDGRRILVLGRSGSGRTTALRRLAHAEAAHGRPVAWVAGKTHAAELALPTGATLVTPQDPEPLVALRRRHHDLLVLVDDADLVRDTPIEPILVEIARLVDRDLAAIAVTADPSAPVQVRGLLPAIAGYRTGLVLRPSDPGDGDALGQRRLPALDGPPGRGYAVLRGRVTEVQVARDPAGAPCLAGRP